MINRDNHTSLSGFRLNNSLETNDQGYFVQGIETRGANPSLRAT